MSIYQQPFSFLPIFNQLKLLAAFEWNSSMTKLFIDTCVWMDIAKTTKSEKMLNLLFAFIDNNDISIIAPELILDEFNRNKGPFISDAGKSLSRHFDKVKEVIRLYATEDQKD